MTVRLFVLFSVLLCAAIISCKKSSEKEPTLTGDWQLVEIFNGYENGGTFQWTPVTAGEADRFSFADDGSFTRSGISNAGPFECSGSFYIHKDTIVKITSNCTLSPGDIVLSELSENMLILNRRVVEGFLRFKYTAVP